MASKRLLCSLLGTILACLASTGIVQGQVSSAQPPEDLEVTALDARVKAFLDKVAADQAQQAFKDLLSGNPMFDGSRQSDAMTNLINKAAELKTNFGECLEVERVTTKKVGSRLVILRYLYHCERFPIIWHFVFYRPPQRRDAVAQPLSSWHVITVRFDAELERLVD